MNVKIVAAFIVGLSCCCLAGNAESFGTVSAFNLVALGSVDSNGQTVLAGNIGTHADVQGRIAAANLVTATTTIGSHLGSDPYGASTQYALVAGAGVSVPPSSYFNVNGGGSAYVPNGGGLYNWNETPRGTVVTSGGSGINFTSLRTSMDAETKQLAAMLANGSVTTTSNGWLVLSGSGAASNTYTFTLTAAQFGNANNIIDIEVPKGATVIINVDGTNVTLQAHLYVNGHQETDADASNILFNFAEATTVTIDSQLDGSILAPTALLTGGSQMGGTFIAAQVGETGEVHNDEFTGTLPGPPSTSTTPEPGTLVLMGSGLLSIAGIFRRRVTA
jgi:choice-of-anchor A domain-containing protein